jgi:dCMP deaminase
MKMRPKKYESLMETAKIWAEQSTCKRAKVGSVIEKGGRIISVGFVGSPPKQPHCLDIGCLIDSEEGGCIRGIHSEINSIGFAARNGISTEGATMYVTMAPCLKCSQAIIASGIKKVVYLKEYRDLRGIKYLEDNGVLVLSFYEDKVILDEGGE